ncbi:arabinose transporter [Acidocella aquatica]|uniref:Arabinose transporter n=1 Tax=Acidocella aquatica TaxID=1922313 RepID=A0ABQ6A618_9PROT|nr:MFS transporter [Acidocella aquatica]GLR66748.1 arabinose transporter [Acidocella aquatica]
MPVTVQARGGQTQLVLLVTILFVSYLTIAMALPVVPVFVHTQLGGNNGWSGFAVGVPFLSTLVTRARAGKLADQRGGKTCLLSGLRYYVLGSVICLLAAYGAFGAELRFALLVLGRLLLGVGEGQVSVGTILWGIGLMGHARAGKVMVLVGISMYGALAVGGPLGLALFHWLGFGGLMLVSTLLPVLGGLTMRRFPGTPLVAGQRYSLWQVLKPILGPGAVVGLQGVGFAALGAFLPLYFFSQNWRFAGWGLTCFGCGFVFMRLIGGNLPDRLGGAPVACFSLALEAAGQYLIWLAPVPLAAFAGALLTGLGCSLVFPAMGREAIKRVEPHLAGTAIGGFAAFQDIAYGATGPLTGLVADHTGYATVFLIGGASATLALALALQMLLSARLAARVKEAD